MRVFFLLLLLVAPAVASAATKIEFSDAGMPTSGVVVVGAFSDGALLPTAARLDEATGGALQRALAARPSASNGNRFVSLLAPSGTDLQEIIIAVVSNRSTLTPRQLQDLGGDIVQKAAPEATELHVAIDAFGEAGINSELFAAQIAYGARLGSYRFDRYMQKVETNGSKGDRIISVMTAAPKDARAHYDARLAPVADAVFLARDLINEPANVIYPESFVQRIRQAARGLDVDIEVLDEKDLQKLNMGALLGVGQGSSRPPRLLIVRYNGAGDDSAPLAFVGKGITFDSGGISIKKSDGMWRMKYDMSGAAAAVSSVLALAGRDARVNAVGIAALAENLPSGTAQRPGDIVKTMSGLTIEIMNTDAEGRLVLSDAVWYAQSRFQPRLMVDLATLTGSVRVALGDDYAGLFSRHDELAEQLKAAGETAGEEIWRLPLHPAQVEDFASPVADLRNGSSKGHAGASIGAQIIGRFVLPETNWAHLDIAGMAWEEEGLPTVPQGAAGYGVRLLDQLVSDYYEN